MAVNKQRQRLEAILERLESGEDVSLRDFKNAMPIDEYGNYEQMVYYRKMELTGGFGYCDGYEKWLKKGIFAYNRAEGFYGKNNKNYQKFHHQAQVYFENAIEALREEFEINPNIGLAYDRGIELDAGVNEGGGLDPSSMPRLKSSKSHMSFDRDGRKIDKRKLKIEAAKRAIAALVEQEQKDAESGKRQNKRAIKRKEGKEDKEGKEGEKEDKEGKEESLSLFGMDAQGNRLRAMRKKLLEQQRNGSK